MARDQDTLDESSADGEAERLRVLASYAVMDTPPDPVLDGIVRLASRLLGVPVGLISLLDDHRQWFKARVGLEVEQTPRDIAFCDMVVRSGRELVVEDARDDPRFANNPLVKGPPNVRFYVGMPLQVPESQVLGTLCAIDTRPRRPDASSLEQLRELAAIASARLVALRNEARLSRSERELLAHDRFFEHSLDLFGVVSGEGRFLELNPRWSQVLGWSKAEMLGKPFLDFVHPEDVARTLEIWAAVGNREDVLQFRNRYRKADGGYSWLEWNALAPRPPETTLFASARDVSALVTSDEALRQQNDLLSLISESQERFTREGASREWWTYVLQRLLALTGSEYGFIGETGVDAEGKFLRTKSITNIAWDDATRAFYEANAPAGLYFRNLKTLFGVSIDQETRVIANEVASDPRAGGRPHGHPPLLTYAGLILRDNERMIGMVGLANRPGGYHDDILDPLEAVLAFLGSILKTVRLENDRMAFVRQLEAATDLQMRVLQHSESGFIALRPDGTVALANERARELLPEVDALTEGSLLASLEALFPRHDHAAWIDALMALPPGARSSPRQVALPRHPPIEVVATRLVEAEQASPGVLLAIADLRERDALRDSMQANAMLEERVAQLRQQQNHNELLSECIEYLQGCATLAEGLELVARSLERLFPSANVALYGGSGAEGAMGLIRKARRFGEHELPDELTPKQCWALRSRRPYGSWTGGHHLPCAHVDREHAGPSFCVPLFSLDRNVAVFLVVFPHDPLHDDPRSHEARLAQFVAMAQSISGALSTIALRESLQRMALTDELTQLPNRRAFAEEVGRGLNRARRAGSPFALAMLDIDHFKQVNDRFGHDAGDQVLRDVAAVMRRSLREGDLVARLGGEEFGIFLPDVGAEAAVQRLDRLLSSIRSACMIGGEPVTASIGVVHAAEAESNAPYDTLYRLADQALYRAKRGGRNRVVGAAEPGSGHPPS
ncbi:MAG: diguanylate cyclase domain-containing protein [Lysobacteraceae bacterium]